MPFPTRPFTPGWRLAAALALAAAGSLPAADFHSASGSGRVAVIELYTSEGCSSCPPADHWLEALRNQRGLWRDFVPIGFHVNYWDNLGWKDRFASRAFTQRQYDLASLWGTRSVYTPCFALDSREWHPGADLRAPEGRPGVLSLALGGDGVCHVHFAPAPGTSAAGLEAHVVLLGGGYESKVTAGENRGATLHHEFVALALADAPMRAEGGGASAELPLPAPAAAGAQRRAVAAWVTRPGRLEPVQATGGWLSRPARDSLQRRSRCACVRRLVHARRVSSSDPGSFSAFSSSGEGIPTGRALQRITHAASPGRPAGIELALGLEPMLHVLSLRRSPLAPDGLGAVGDEVVGDGMRGRRRERKGLIFCFSSPQIYPEPPAVPSGAQRVRASGKAPIHWDAPAAAGANRPSSNCRRSPDRPAGRWVRGWP